MISFLYRGQLSNVMAWVSTKGIANEPTIDSFVQSIGGKRVSSIVPKPTFENADYIFVESSIVLELKIIETEFGESKEFRKKSSALIAKDVEKYGRPQIPLLGRPFTQDFISGISELYRRPLSRITKQANRQIKATKKHFGIPNGTGILLCVNDNFRGIKPAWIANLFSRILKGSCRSIEAVIYVTNHCVTIPKSDVSHFLWVPIYRQNPSKALVDFVNRMGQRWGDLCAQKIENFTSRIETEDLSLLVNATPIRRTDKK
jgi:hypothetical protein